MPVLPRNILAIDTTSDYLSLALQAGEGPPASRYLLRGKEISRVMLGEIDGLLAAASLLPEALELLVVAVGPGSFTGTRMGMALAASFAQVLVRPLIGVDTLSLLAAQTAPPEGEAAGPAFHAVLNCVRDEVYHAPFRWSAGQPEALAPIALATIPELEGIAGGAPVVVRRFEPADPQWEPVLARLRPAPLRRPWPDATLLLELGRGRFASNPSGPFPRPQPIYLKSEAFRTWRAAQK